MIAILPDLPSVGPLKLIEAYEYYDGPKLFACENGVGQIYFGLWVDQTTEYQSFWLVPCTKERFFAVRSGALDLFTAFYRSENGFFFRSDVYFGDARTVSTPMLSEQMDGDLLPDPGDRLDLQTETLPVRFASLDLSSHAVANRREVVGLHLDLAGAKREEVPTKSLGRILVAVQETLDSLGQQLRGQATLRGTIAPDILLATKTQVIQAAGGSFALEIVADRSVDLFNHSLATDAISSFIELISAGNEVEQLRALLIQVEPRAASKYKLFLASMLAMDASVRIDWASPEPTRNRTVRLDLNTAAGALKTAEQVTSEVGETRTSRGYFVGIELPRKSFVAILAEDDATYRGRIADSAFHAAEHVTLSLNYLITLRETVDVTVAGEEKYKYELLDIRSDESTNAT